MSRLTIDYSEQFTQVEEVWLKGNLDGNCVGIHAVVYKCDAGKWHGQFGAAAHLHSEKGGQVRLSSGILMGDTLAWGATKSDALKAAFAKLESQSDLKV